MQDLETINMDDFRHNYVNLTGFRLVNYEDLRVQDIMNQMRIYEKHTGSKLLNNSGGLVKVC